LFLMASWYAIFFKSFAVCSKIVFHHYIVFYQLILYWSGQNWFPKSRPSKNTCTSLPSSASYFK
jgi:hypothetical protein